jgi:hypothetical protein
MEYSLYDGKGEITRVYLGEDPEIQGSTYFVEGRSDDLLQYIPDVLVPVITDKPKLAVVESEGVITGVPPETVVTIAWGPEFKERSEETITDGSLDLNGSDPGTYKVTLTLFPYKIEELEVDIL